VAVEGSSNPAAPLLDAVLTETLLDSMTASGSSDGVGNATI
jgi:hypothetical protein